MNQSALSGSPITLRGGPVAIEHIRQHGLQAADIAVIPAAAGGPKGLILQGIDQWLFGEWLPAAPRQRSLIGASIGSWRMAAASMPDPARAFARLGELYCGQTYPPKPSSRFVTDVLQDLLNNLVSGHTQQIISQPLHRLHILTNRGRGLLRAPSGSLQVKAGFVAASLANAAGRRHLAHHIERVVFSDQRDPLAWMRNRFDGFHTEFRTLDTGNLTSALLASGTLPLIMDPVRDIAGADGGTFWDGGLIDYHLALPYARLSAEGAAGNLVLYPHFAGQVIPGWLDKAFAWRRANKGRNRHWLDNVLLVAPSDEFVRTLPRRKLPDRSDFFHHGTDHQRRINEWQESIGASERMRDALAEFVAQPDPSRIVVF